MASLPIRVITEASSSGAQVIDGSLKFDGTKKTYLQRTVGNVTTFTLSFWYKSCLVNRDEFFDTTSSTGFYFYRDGQIKINTNSANIFTSHGYYRDPSAFYHVVFNYDGTTANLWVNGKLDKSAAISTQLYSGTAMISSSHATDTADYYLSQYYVIDGMALGPGYFGFTDPLTNTWRPKAFKAEGTTVNDGTTWSDFITTTSGGYTSGYDATKAFNADITDWSAPANGGADKWLGVTSANPLRISCQLVEIKFWATKLEINEEVVYELAAGGDRVETFYISNFDTFKIYGKADGSKAALYYIKIDGVLMLDSTTQSLAYGTNGSYLPMDGDTRIGEDQSGNGNDWTPTNLPDTRPLDKATGGMPTLTTVSGGKVATMGIRTDTSQGNGPVGVNTGCVLALPLVGILTDVSYRINSSSTQKLPAASGASGVSTEGNFYEGSYSFDGTTDYIDVDASSEFDLGTGDFTVELWMRSWVDSADTYYRRIYMTDGPTGNAAGNFQLTIEPSTGKINLWDGAASGGLNLLGTTNVANNQWNHIAAVRSGGTLKGYVNGTQETSGSYSVAISPNSGSPRPRLGNFSGSGGTGDYNGFIQDLRVYKGVAKYTDNFLVGSSNPSVVTESPSGAVYSSELTKVTDGAVSFEGGNDDYLSLNPGADFAFGTGDFTVELYLYYNGAPAQYDYIIDARNSGQTTGTWSLSHDYVNTGSGLLMFSTDSSALLTASHNPLHNRWTHIAVSRNGSSLKMFYDGVEVATASNTTNFSTSPSTSYIGTRYSTEHSFVGLISNLRVVKGTALYTANFTPPTSPLTNVTNTKLLCCNFPDSATNSTVQPNAISATGSVSGTPFGPFDSNIDTVIGRPTNYCTLNPLSNGGLSLSDGNLKVSEGSGPHMRVNGTVGVTTGKWYYEVTNNSQPYDDSGQDTNSSAGIGNYEASLTSYPGSDANSYVYQYASDGNGTKKINGGTDTSWPTGFTAGTPKGVTVMIAFDLDNSKIWFGRQGIWLDDGDPVGGKNSVYALTSGMQYTPTCRPRGTGGVNATINFGQNPFKYPAPEGFSPVCGASIQTPEILRPDLYVGVTTFTGTGSGNGNQEVTFPFKPDMVITKQRSGTASSGVYDTVRGTNSKLYTNSASQANTNNDAGPASWDYRGVTLDDTGDDIVYNGAAGVAWGWKAGGNPGITTTGIYIDGVSYASAAAAGLDGGSIDPNAASIGTKEGFSILKYTANNAEVPQSVAHGLTKKPDFAIFKNIESTLGVNEVDWGVYHKSIGATKVLELNQNLAMQDYDGPFNDTEPTSSLFYFGGKSGGSIMGHSYTTNGPAGDDFIGYIWHDVPGLQKFGTYEGDDANGSGPFVDCGFRPSLILIKNVDAAQDWILIDGTRDPNNVSYRWLKPNSNGAENTTTTDNCIDILSNGFIPRGANTSNDATNGPSQTIVYAAWAAEPIHNLYGGQSNAR